MTTAWRQRAKKGIATVSVFAASLGLMAVGPAPAQAGHNNGTVLCERGDGGRNYNHVFSLPITNNDDVVIGRVSVNRRAVSNGHRICAVTIREFHVNPKWTVVAIRRIPREWRRDAGNYYYYAGPIYACACGGDSVEGRGSIAGHEHGFMQ